MDAPAPAPRPADAEEASLQAFALSPRAFRTASSLGHRGSLESALSSPPPTPLGGTGAADAAAANAANAADPTASSPRSSIGAASTSEQQYNPSALPWESRYPEQADAELLARHCTREKLAAMLAALARLPPPAPIPDPAMAAGSPRAAAAAAHEAARAAELERKASEGLEAFEVAAREREREAEAITPLNAERRDAWETSSTACRVHELLQSGGEEGLTPATLRRWLIARKGDGARAARDLAAHSAWRATLVPLGRILEDAELAPELAQNKVVLAAAPDDDDDGGKEAGNPLSSLPSSSPPLPKNPAHHGLTALTARGHAVVLLYAQRHVSHHSRDPLSSTRVRRVIMYAIDAAVAASVPSPSNPCRKIVGVFDLSGFSRRNFDVGGLKAIFEALNHHYPERLSSLILLRAPPAFAALWMLVKPFIDPVTAAKVRFVGSLLAMRRLMARLMAGEAAAHAAEQCERRRAQVARRQQQQQQQKQKNKYKKEQGPSTSTTTEADELEQVPPELEAAALAVERALGRLPAAIVGEGFGMADARVPTIDRVTARLVTAGRLPRARGGAETVPLPRAEEPEVAEEEEGGKGGDEAAAAASAAEAAASSLSSWSARLKLPQLMKRVKEFSLYSSSAAPPASS